MSCGSKAVDSVDELWASGGREGPPMVSPKGTIRDAVKQGSAEQGFLTPEMILVMLLLDKPCCLDDHGEHRFV